MLRRIASRMAGCTGSVFVFCDIQATSRRCSWANSKLSFDDMDGDLGFRVCEDFTGHIACGRLVPPRSEEHTSELQSLAYLVCRLLLEKKKNIYIRTI